MLHRTCSTPLEEGKKNDSLLYEKQFRNMKKKVLLCLYV